jgi:hypothetical protein
MERFDVLLDLLFLDGSTRRSSFSSHFPYLEKENGSMLMSSPCCVCVPVSVTPPTYVSTFEYLNQSSWNLVYHKNGARLNGVLHLSLQSVCVSVCLSFLSLLGKGSVKCLPSFIARQRLSNGVPAAMKNCSRRRFLLSPYRISKKNRLLLLQRISCYFHKIYRMY